MTSTKDRTAYQCIGLEQDLPTSKMNEAYKSHTSARDAMVPSGTMGQVMMENKQRTLRVNEVTISSTAVSRTVPGEAGVAGSGELVVSSSIDWGLWESVAVVPYRGTVASACDVLFEGDAV